MKRKSCQRKRNGWANFPSLVLMASVIVSGLSPMVTSYVAQAANPSLDGPKNVIILISDGMGYNHMDATSYYQYGRTGEQVYEKFPVKLAVSTYSADGNGYDAQKTWSALNYVQSGYTDSAPAATAMSTGSKTFDAAIGVDVRGKPLKHMFQYAKEQGKKIGVVTSVEFSHATPAGFVAHNVSRNNYSQIANEMIYSSTLDIDLIMGVGHPFYTDNGVYSDTLTFGKSGYNKYQYVGGQKTWDDLVAGTAGGTRKWTLIQSIADFQSLATTATPPDRVIGVPQVHTTLQQARSGNGFADPYVVPFNTNVPTLTLMTQGALNMLGRNSTSGFYMMIEGGAVDWAGHANQSGRMIEEQIDFNRAAEAVVDWVEKNSSWDETLVIVTSDHETGYLLGPNSCNNDPKSTAAPTTLNPIINKGTGKLPDMQWCNKVAAGYGNHTNQLVPLFAKGKGANFFDYYADQVDPIRGRYIDNTEIAKLIIGWLDPLPTQRPKNLIVMISDGCGYNQIAATNYYEQGKLWRQAYENFPFQSGMQTFEIDGHGYDTRKAWGDFTYVKDLFTDSAAAATAMSTGIKTFDGAIGMDARFQALKHMFQLAEEEGKSTGVVSSVEFSHATPAGFVAHNISRNNYSDIANEMILNSKTDVIMGTGHPKFDNDGQPVSTPNYRYVGGEATWNNLVAGTAKNAENESWTLLQTKADFEAYTSGTPTATQVIGVPQVYETLQYNRKSTGGYGASADKPFETPFNANVPDLSTMSKAALNILDEDSDGLYLMIEGGAVDWASHGNSSGRMIEEQIDFNKAVNAVIDWVEKNSNWNDTLLIVTGDHETGYLTGKSGDTAVNPPPDWHGVKGNAILDKMKWNSGDHTNSIVPFFAKGKAARLFEYYADQLDIVRGRYIDNTEIAKLIFDWDTIVKTYPNWRKSWGSMYQRDHFAPHQYPMLTKLGRFSNNVANTAEIAAYDSGSKRLFTTNAVSNTVDILDISNPASPTLVKRIDVSSIGSPNSVAAHNGTIAVALENANKQANGFVAFYDTNGTHQKTVTVGALPDMLTFTPDGMKVVVANEGEPNDTYTTDPEGSVSIIDLSAGVASATVKTLGFSDFNVGGPRAHELPGGVRIFGPNATVAKDLEPEYITVSNDSKRAWVTLQENNAVAILDLTGAMSVTHIAALGFKDHTAPGNGLDVSDKDSATNIKNWPVKGMYQPDSIGEYNFGSNYLVTANEGDSRGYAGYSEEVRVKNIPLKPAAFPGFTITDLIKDANLGRMQVTIATMTVGTPKGDIDNDGKFEEIYSYGARSFAIWTANGNLVYDSGDQMEQDIAANPAYSNSFNSEYDAATGKFTKDSRSDNKGPEPEGVDIGDVGGQTYAFVGLERMGGVMVYDVTYPTMPTFIQYFNDTDFSKALPGAGDVGPEGVLFIPADKSPTGYPLVVVTFEVSGSVAIYGINTVQFSTANYTASEGAGKATITAKLAMKATHPLSVTYTTHDGTAVMNKDYTIATGVLTFAAGEDTKTFDVPITNNALDNNDKNVRLILRDPVGISLGSLDKATLTIQDDDAEPTVQLSSATYSVGESAVSATITATLSAASSKEIKVDYATANGTATAASDYTQSAGTLTFKAGEKVKTFVVPIIQDTLIEGDETVNLSLSNPVNAVLGTIRNAILTIKDDDSVINPIETPIISLKPSTQKVKESVGKVSFDVVLNKPSRQQATVTCKTSDGTATAGKDYTAVNSNLVFATGQTTKTVDIPILNDSDAERTETFTITLSAPISSTLSQHYTATVAILDDDTFHIRLMHTNDHHSHLEPVTDSTYGELGGIARRKTVVDRLRAESVTRGDATLLLDAGDVFQGTLYFNQYLGQADLYFYNQLQYDAMTIGNHEFDKGPQTLADFINGATFPVLSANTNVANSTELNGKIKPWVILERGGEKIGIFGLTPEDTSILSSPGSHVTFSDPIAAAKKAVDELTAQNVNKIVALTHMGYDNDKQLAQSVDGIDIIVGGHSHTPFGNQPGAANPYPVEVTTSNGNKTLIVTNWEWGKFLGNIQLTFDAKGNIIAWEGQPIPIDKTITPDAAFTTKMQEYAAPLETARKKVIGKTAVDLNGERKNVRSRETNLANLITDAMIERASNDGCRLAITNGGGIRASIPKGDVTIGQVIEVLPFGNTIACVTITGAQVKEALENGVSQVETGAGRFPQVGNIRFTWSPSATVGSRIVQLQVKDSAGTFNDIDPTASYRVATNNYMLTGGDGYSVFTKGSNPVDTGYVLADVVQEYITAHSPVSPTVEGRIRVQRQRSIDSTKDDSFNSDETITVNGKSVPRLLLLIPKGAWSTGIFIRHTPIFTPTKPGLKRFVLSFLLEALDADGKVIVKPTFSKPLTITLRYIQAEIEKAGINESKLSIFYWDETTNAWVMLPSLVDKENDTVEASCNHFTEFALAESSITPQQTNKFIYLPVVQR